MGVPCINKNCKAILSWDWCQDCYYEVNSEKYCDTTEEADGDDNFITKFHCPNCGEFLGSLDGDGSVTNANDEWNDIEWEEHAKEDC